MDEAIRTALERPFDPSLVRQRSGPNGKTLSYVEVSQYVRRLNEAFANTWAFEITHRERDEDQVLVEVRITAVGVVKMGLGGAPIARRRDNGKPVSLAHDYMAAEATALKRACRLFGIGGTLYLDEEEAAPTDFRDQPITLVPTKRVAQVLGPERMHARASATPRRRLTSRQLAAIRALSARRGMDAAELRTRSVASFGSHVEYLTQEQASHLIEQLGAETTVDRGRNGSAGAEPIR